MRVAGVDVPPVKENSRKNLLLIPANGGDLNG
jgi:hypothetical protein